MFNRQFLVFLGIGLAVVAVVVGVTLYGTKGAHLELDGKILKVRTLATDEKNAIVVVDFRVVNRATKQTFVVQDAFVVVTGPDGKTVEGETVARTDVNRIFDYYKMLGQRYNETLIIRDKVAGGQTMDRMVVSTVALPEADVEGRKNLTLRLHDIDGPTFEIKER